MGNYLGFVYDAVRSFAGDVQAGPAGRPDRALRRGSRCSPSGATTSSSSRTRSKASSTAEGRAPPRPPCSTPPICSRRARAPRPCCWSRTPRPRRSTRPPSCGDGSASSARRSSRSRLAPTARCSSRDTTCRTGRPARAASTSTRSTHDEMDRAFERMATWLRAPDRVPALVPDDVRGTTQAEHDTGHAAGPRSDADQRRARAGAAGQGRGGRGDPRHLRQHAHADQRRHPPHRRRQEGPRRPVAHRAPEGRARGAARPGQRDHSPAARTWSCRSHRSTRSG